MALFRCARMVVTETDDAVWGVVAGPGDDQLLHSVNRQTGKFSMGKRTYCCAVGCTNSRGLIKIPFYRIPVRPPQRRRAWICAISRKNWTPNENTRLCAAHFVGGKKSDKPGSRSYIPTVFTHKQRLRPSKRKKLKRKAPETLTSREKRQRNREKMREHDGRIHRKQATEHENFNALMFHDYTVSECPATSSISASLHDHDYCIGATSLTVTANNSTLDESIKKIKDLQLELDTVKEKLKETEKKILSLENIKDDDKLVHFYTSLPNYATFKALFEYFEPDAAKNLIWRGKYTTTDGTWKNDIQGERKLCLESQFFAVLVQLRLGMLNKEVARNFGISESYFSRIFTTWIHFLSNALQSIIQIPSSEELENEGVLPQCFKRYTRVKLVIDCTEIFSERPSQLQTRKQTWSNYKHHDTFKFLIGVSAKGAICYVSNMWGGRASDKCITRNCGIMDEFEAGDSCIADRGFDMEAEFSTYGVNLIIPSFKASRSQLTGEEVSQSRRISECRIHVERAIGRLKNFHILDRSIPLSMKRNAEQIVKTCGYLTNFQSPTIKL
ncbi:uncharacterized protein [Ptychodera flava]|uniref:uncharacterized protein n=1 Tax=Ptychodera flava TaxID=63121 RepID=UPI003969CB2C